MPVSPHSQTMRPATAGLSGTAHQSVHGCIAACRHRNSRSHTHVHAKCQKAAAPLSSTKPPAMGPWWSVPGTSSVADALTAHVGNGAGSDVTTCLTAVVSTSGCLSTSTNSRTSRCKARSATPATVTTCTARWSPSPAAPPCQPAPTSSRSCTGLSSSSPTTPQSPPCMLATTSGRSVPPSPVTSVCFFHARSAQAAGGHVSARSACDTLAGYYGGRVYMHAALHANRVSMPRCHLHRASATMHAAT